jgi:hypothetical protein
MAAVLSAIGGGIAGSAFTYGLSWVRERRRTLDAYRSPQRQALGEIITTTYALMMRELDQRLAMTDLIKQLRKDEQSEMDAERMTAALTGLGGAFLDVERAFRIGALTIVDPPCWEAMGSAYFKFRELGSAFRSGGAAEMQTIEDVEQYIEVIQGHTSEFGKSVDALTPAANNRLSPAETRWNRWRRRAARRRLGEHYQELQAIYQEAAGG